MRQKGADMIKSNKLKKYMLFLAAAAACGLLLAAVSVIYQRYKYDYSGVPDAVSSMTDGLECRLIVTANASRIEDRQAFAEEIFGMCRANSFRSVRLSTDVSGWPSRLDVTVYLHRYDIGRSEPEMRIHYIPPDEGEQYNIRDDGDKYRIIIE